MGIRYLFLFLCVLVLQTVSSYAQQDERISAEPLAIVLPDDAKIQSADRIGELTLAVWGTTRSDPNNNVANTLVMQLLRDTVLVGPQRTVTSETARPFGLVQVVALNGIFLVIWNDRRGGDSVAYMQRIDTTGALVGSAEQFSDHTIGAFGIARLSIGNGYKLFWNEGAAADTSIYWRTCSGAGAVGAKQGPLPGSVQQVVAVASMPGVNLLHRGNQPPLVVYPDGVIDTLSGDVAHRFTLPYYLNEDGSVVILENDTLRWYQTVFEKMAYKVLKIPKLAGAHPGSLIVSRDSSGQMVVLWASGGVGFYIGGQNGSDIAWVYVYRMKLTPADTFAIPELYHQLIVEWPINYTQGVATTYQHGDYERKCDNFYRVGLQFHVVKHIHIGGGLPDTSYAYTNEVFYDINGVSAVVTSGSFNVWRSYHPLPTCTSVSDVAVQRSQSKNASEIEVSASRKVHLATPAVVQRSDAPQKTPGITIQQGTILVGWQSIGIDTLFELGSWQPGELQNITMLPALTFNQVPEIAGDTISHTGTDVLDRRSGHFLLSSVHRWYQQGDSLPRREYVLHTPTQQGWRRSVATMLRPLDRYYFVPMSYSHNPDTGEILGMLERFVENYRAAVWVFAQDSLGNKIWTADSVFVTPVDDNQFRPIDLIALGDTEYLSIYYGTATHFQGRDTVRTFSLPVGSASASLQPSYVKLLGPYLLRWRSDNRLHVDILSTDGQLIAERLNLNFPSGTAGYHIIQNPADSGFAILFGTKSGGSITLLDKSLNLLQSDIPISSSGVDVRNPVGVFRNDTLFAVWEDYRDGIPDIYGRAISVRTSLSVAMPGEAIAAKRILSITPNPSNTRTIIKLDRDYKEGRLDVIDSRGETRMQIPTPSEQVIIDTEELPTGVYRVVLRSAGSVESKPLVVIR